MLLLLGVIRIAPTPQIPSCTSRSAASLGLSLVWNFNSGEILRNGKARYEHSGERFPYLTTVFLLFTASDFNVILANIGWFMLCRHSGKC